MTAERTIPMVAPLCACPRPLPEMDIDTLELRCIRCSRLVDGLPVPRLPSPTTEQDR
jgi:hypothetical protein